ncbi:hypothetical protein CQ019_05550 [Arthrobacter sp. MYb229]|uniref:hypothetical protein n=1 Tax=Micrococcaceae TaxID=1268 RepID=UPI000BB8EBEB|nr:MULTISPECIES: hypothetical protein [Micrococcaceae]PCC27353.1 hypothetical protein CIK76_17410 [Glutamicibacter sp. BW80]PRA06825.1 hypothetical protein CQ019_05550 [Arthrobacter sp. MYb229]PRB53727.1 hypothetical protein CQ013_05550 [Arthrobacter sp. MYb216]
MHSRIRTGGRSNFLRAGALLAAAQITLCACSSSEGASSLSLTSGTPRAVVDGQSADAQGAPAGEGEGELLVGPGGCFALDGDDGAPALLVFPEATQVLTDGWPGLALADEQYLVGNDVLFSGGYRKLDSAEREAVSACQPQGEAFFVQAPAEK